MQGPPFLLDGTIKDPGWLPAGKEACFVPLLPPKKTTGISSGEALEFQLRYRPEPTDVVAFKEVTCP